MKVLVFLGTVRESSPPSPKRLGLRVARALISHSRLAHCDVSLIDPLDIALDKPFKPHFAYAPGKAPVSLQALAADIETADGYVMVSPEYNHAMSPALADLLNHFGSSGFSFKPSVITTYSAGQWGGTRAAVNMRTFLSELGCLPVSAMIHIPKAQEVFDETGAYLDSVDAEHWASYLDRGLAQLIWWAGAAAHWRNTVHQPTAAFTGKPSERNAP